jgi:hypothetical protein|uniref:Uncharacterized protein n=1 Tax=Picea glauca TaxID=3330 RepID=A0A124GP77_PICGL|nr:hypothetical protein ABT39_MTgene927 [Picea glauca]
MAGNGWIVYGTLHCFLTRPELLPFLHPSKEIGLRMVNNFQFQCLCGFWRDDVLLASTIDDNMHRLSFHPKLGVKQSVSPALLRVLVLRWVVTGLSLSARLRRAEEQHCGLATMVL